MLHIYSKICFRRNSKISSLLVSTVLQIDLYSLSIKTVNFISSSVISLIYI